MRRPRHDEGQELVGTHRGRNGKQREPPCHRGRKRNLPPGREAPICDGGAEEGTAPQNLYATAYSRLRLVMVSFVVIGVPLIESPNWKGLELPQE
jgi:hypothetical protein